MASLRAINQLDNGKIPIFGYRHNGIWALGEYFIAKSAERRGRSCAGPKIMSQPLYKYVEHCLWAGLVQVSCFIQVSHKNSLSHTNLRRSGYFP